MQYHKGVMTARVRMIVEQVKALPEAEREEFLAWLAEFAAAHHDEWDAKIAHFRVNNPTTRDVTTDFATVAAIRGFKPVKTKITVKAGMSVEVK